MLNRKYAMLVGAAAAAMPLAANAALITFSFNLSDIMIATSTNGTYSVPAANLLTGTAAAPVLTVPNGDFIKVGVNVLVTGDTYAGNAALGDPSEILGVAAFQTGLSDSNAAVAYVAPGGAAGTTLTTPVINADFTGSKNAGQTDGLGGVNAALGTIGANSFNGLPYSSSMSYGSVTPSELYNSEKLKANASSGTATFTLTNNASAFQYATIQTPAHLTAGGSSVPSTFKNTTFNAATDTFAPMPTLTIIIAGSATSSSTTSSSAQPIISLLTTLPTTYASQLGSTIALTYTGPGGYVPGSTTFSASNKGYGVVTGFHTPDTEIYALDVLNASGGILTSAQITAVVSDINASESGVTASLVTGIYTKLFPGYDVLLTATTPAVTGTTDYLGIDFSATGDQDPATQGFTVGAIAAVPEPATLAGVVLGASGLLLKRRKNRAA